MDKKQIEKAVGTLLKEAKKKNFVQSVDLIINLKDLNMKKPEEQVDAFVSLPHGRGRPVKVAAFVGPELADQAKKDCSAVVKASEFKTYDKIKIKKLAESNDFFIAQANVMKDVAIQFGKVLGPRNKMPNPKAGAIVPPNANLKTTVERMQKIVRVSARKSPVVHVSIGKQNQTSKELTDNIFTVYNQVMHALPKEENNIKDVHIKLTMSKPVKV